MLRKLISRLSYANVVATIALFAALGTGGAYAANEWNSSNIQDETLTGADIKGRPGAPFSPAVNGTLTGHDISGQAANAGSGTPFVDGSLTGADIRDGSLKDEDIGETAVRDIRVYVGTVPANGCQPVSISGYGNPDGDHLVITPWFLDVDSRLSYTAQYDTRGYQHALVRVCNPTTSAVNDEYTTFNMLVINGG